jgi:hypothetical protein
MAHAAGSEIADNSWEDKVVSLCSYSIGGDGSGIIGGVEDGQQGGADVAQCFIELMRDGRMHSEDVKVVCTGAAAAASTSSSSSSSSSSKEKNVKCAKYALYDATLKRPLSSPLIARLCSVIHPADSKAIGPIECAQAAPFKLSSSELITLCTGAIDAAPANCANHEGGGGGGGKGGAQLSGAAKVKLCQGSDTVVPVVCYDHAIGQGNRYRKQASKLSSLICISLSIFNSFLTMKNTLSFCCAFFLFLFVCCL